MSLSQYHSREEFISDVELIYTNSKRYNGPDSAYTATALKIAELAKQCMTENEDQLVEMEEGIRQKQVIIVTGAVVRNSVVLILSPAVGCSHGGSRVRQYNDRYQLPRRPE